MPPSRAGGSPGLSLERPVRDRHREVRHDDPPNRRRDLGDEHPDHVENIVADVLLESRARVPGVDRRDHGRILERVVHRRRRSASPSLNPIIVEIDPDVEQDLEQELLGDRLPERG